MSGKAFLSTKIGPLYLRPDNIPALIASEGGIVIDDGPTGALGIAFRNLGPNPVTVQVRESDDLTQAERDLFQLPGLATEVPAASTNFANVGATVTIVSLGKTAVIRSIIKRFVQIKPTTNLDTTLLVYLVKLNDGGLENAALDVLDDPDLPVRA